jgi:hypothetical protein
MGGNMKDGFPRVSEHDGSQWNGGEWRADYFLNRRSGVRIPSGTPIFPSTSGIFRRAIRFATAQRLIDVRGFRLRLFQPSRRSEAPVRTLDDAFVTDPAKLTR